MIFNLMTLFYSSGKSKLLLIWNYITKIRTVPIAFIKLQWSSINCANWIPLKKTLLCQLAYYPNLHLHRPVHSFIQQILSACCVLWQASSLKSFAIKEGKTSSTLIVKVFHLADLWGDCYGFRSCAHLRQNTGIDDIWQKVFFFTEASKRRQKGNTRWERWFITILSIQDVLFK